MSQSPRGRLALVTGAGTGIGRAVAERLAAGGDRVVLVGRRAEPLRETAAACAAAGGEGIAFPADLTAPGAAERLAAEVDRQGGALSILVQSAGEALSGTVEETSPEEWERILTVNLTAPFLVARALLPALRRVPGASIVNVASTLGLAGLPRAAAYCAAKGGLVQLTRAMALDLAREGIRVNAVCPGVVDTPMLRRDRGDGLGADERAAALAEVHPVGRVGRPEEIADVVVHLCSDGAGFTTGVAWPVDGGMTAGWWGGPGKKR